MASHWLSVSNASRLTLPASRGGRSSLNRRFPMIFAAAKLIDTDRRPLRKRAAGPIGSRPAPKEQPPRKLSGERTSGRGTSGKQAAPRSVVSPKGKAAGRLSAAGQSLRYSTEGARAVTSWLRRGTLTGDADVRRLRIPTIEVPISKPPRCTALHLSLGAKMVPFAGYAMPVQYPAGVKDRAPAHPRQGRAVRRLPHGPGAADRGRMPRPTLEALVPGDLQALSPGAYALHDVHRPRRRHPRRSDRHQCR